MILTLEDYLRSRPNELREHQRSGEVRADMSVLALASVRFEWSSALGREVAYLPDSLLAISLGTSIETIRTHYGQKVLILPNSVRVR